MTDAAFSDAQLLGYLDELLDVAEMVRIEQCLRDDESLRERLSRLSAQRDAGVHALGDMWRRHRLTCLSRSQWGSFLLQALAPDEMAYAEFHLAAIGCRYCQANLADLRSQQADPDEQASERQQRLFQTSVGRTPRK